jgi:hypothetical protein
VRIIKIQERNEMIHNIFGESRECAQTFPETIGVVIGEEILNCAVGTLPDGKGLHKQASPLWRQLYLTGAAVGRVCCNFDQSAAL